MSNEAHNPASCQTAIIGSCCEIASKKRGFIYVDEECGNRAKIEIEYTLNNKHTQKKLCNVIAALRRRDISPSKL